MSYPEELHTVDPYTSTSLIKMACSLLHSQLDEQPEADEGNVTLVNVKEVDGQMFICADHGNAEQLVDYETGTPFTAHTINPVPFILVNADPAYKLREEGCLADIVPTLIETMGMTQPAEMTGKSLLVK